MQGRVEASEDSSRIPMHGSFASPPHRAKSGRAGDPGSLRMTILGAGADAIELPGGGTRLPRLLAACRAVLGWTAEGGCPYASTAEMLLFLFLFLDCEVVGYGEYALDGVGLNAGDLLVHLAGDYAFERDVSVLHDDVNGRNGTHLVLA